MENSTSTTPIMAEIVAEMARAVAKSPTWPSDPFHALSIVGEEYGELQKAVVQFTYEKHKGVTREDIRAEAIQTAAMAIRFAISLSDYTYAPGHQHRQSSSAALMPMFDNEQVIHVLKGVREAVARSHRIGMLYAKGHTPLGDSKAAEEREYLATVDTVLLTLGVEV